MVATASVASDTFGVQYPLAYFLRMAGSSVLPLTGFRPSDSGTTRRVVAAAVATTVVGILPVFLVGGLAVQLRAEWGFSPTGLGLAVATFYGMAAVASVPAGRMVERYGATVTARVAIGIGTASMALIAIAARSLLSMVCLLAVAAWGNAIGQPAANASLARRGPRHRQGAAFGLKQAAVPTAALLAGASVPLLALTVHWRAVFVAGAALAPLALLLVRGDDTGSGPRPRSVRPPRALVLVGVAAFFAAAAANTLSTFLVVSAASTGLSPALAGTTLTWGSALTIATRIGGGLAADRWRHGHLTVVALALAVGAGGLTLLGTAGAVAMVAGVTLAFGLGWGWPGLQNYAVVTLHPQAPAAATAITQTGVNAGSAVGPLLFGAVATGFGYPTMWSWAAVSMLGAAGLMLYGAQRLTAHGPIPRQRQRRRGAPAPPPSAAAAPRRTGRSRPAGTPPVVLLPRRQAPPCTPSAGIRRSGCR